jgi:hypothetical protein
MHLFDGIKVLISEYPQDYIPPNVEPFCFVDTANGVDETYLVKGFRDKKGVVHLQEIIKVEGRDETGQISNAGCCWKS